MAALLFILRLFDNSNFPNNRQLLHITIAYVHNTQNKANEHEYSAGYPDDPADKWYL